MSSNLSKRVLAIGLDAAEPTLVEKWMNEGILSNLKHLCTKGMYGRLKSSADWLAGSPWPTFYTGTNPSEHGLYETMQWNPERMMSTQTSPDWLPVRPFWREFGENGPRVVSVDLPMTYSPEKFNGVEICGWMTYDSIGNLGTPTSYPETEINRLRDEFGLEPVSITCDKWGIQTVKSLLRMRDQVIRATENTAELAKTLMIHEKWDLFLAAFASPHRAGHKLWDASGTFRGASSRDWKAFSHALRDIYVACDKAVGQLTENVGSDVHVLVFSLHGMRANTNRSHVLPRMLDSILNARLKGNKQSGETELSFRRKIRKQLPSTWLSIAFPNYSTTRRMFFYPSSKISKPVPTTVETAAFALVTCLNGYIRINLRGREKNGFVEPGEEYNQLCSWIVEDAKTFVDADTGEPIVEEAIRCNELFKSGARREFLPDILLKWMSTPTVNHHCVVSNRYPSLSIPMPIRNLDGRSGNHTSEGFLIATGDSIPATSTINDGNILDLAPTILALLNVGKPVEMCGTSLLSHGKEDEHAG